MASPATSVVLLHGFGSTFDHNWRQTGWVDILGDFGGLAPDLDLPGHGSSVRSTDPASYAAVDEEVAASIPPSTAAVGFSAGAEILLRIAVAHPGSFPRLVLLGLGDNLFEPSNSTALVEALQGGTAPEDIQARVFTRLAETTGNDPSALAAFLQRPRRPVREADLAAVACPVLVVLGELFFVGPADRLVAALPSATLVSVPGVDHFATPSDFRVIEATMKFLGFD
jgi:pimeloyl-ACP methyl ester carboxylesterase